MQEFDTHQTVGFVESFHYCTVEPVLSFPKWPPKFIVFRIKPDQQFNWLNPGPYFFNVSPFIK